MLGQIFQSRFRVESLLSEGRGWRSWSVRDIINQRPLLLFIYLPSTDGQSLDRSSVAWRLARYREILREGLPAFRLTQDAEGLSLLCGLPPEARELDRASAVPPVLAETLERDRMACLREGLAPPLADRRLVWLHDGDHPLYLPPSLFTDPSRPESLDEPIQPGMTVPGSRPSLPGPVLDTLAQVVSARKAGRPVLLRARCGRPGGLAAWKSAIESRLRTEGASHLADALAPAYFLVDFSRPSCQFSGLWPELAAGAPVLAVLDADSLDRDPLLAARCDERFKDRDSLRSFEISLPALPENLPDRLPDALAPEGRSFLELLSLFDEPVSLGFLLDLLQVEEPLFHSMLSGLERARTLALEFGSIDPHRRGFRIEMSNASLKSRVREGIEAGRLRELHVLILGLMEKRKQDGLEDGICRFHHRRGVARDELATREGMRVFARLVDRGLELPALSVSDLLMDDAPEGLSSGDLKELVLFRGKQRLRRDDLHGAERVHRRGLAVLTGRDDYLDELQLGARPKIPRRVDSELLSALSAVIRSHAEIAEIRGEFASAAGVLQGFLDAYSESLPAKERGILYNELAWILYRRGEHQGAVERCETALRLFDANEDPAELGQTFNTLGAAQWALGNWREAEAFYLKALKLREGAGDPARVAASLNNLGNLYRMLEQLPKAIEYFQRSMEIKRTQGNEAGYLVSLFNVALSSFEMNDLKTARRQGEECLALNEKVGNIQLGAEVLGLLGEIDLVEGRYDSARESLERALRICIEIEAHTESASMFRRLAGVHLALGDLDAAARVIEDGLVEARRVGGRFEEAQILVYRGECLAGTGDVEGAIRSLEAAADILSVLDKMEWLARVYSRMGLMHLESQREARAQELLQQASGIIERRRITVPMQEWDKLQARLQNRRERLFDSLGEHDSRSRLAGFLRILDALESGSDSLARAERILEQLALAVPSRRAAIFLEDGSGGIRDLPGRVALHGDFPDVVQIAEEGSRHLKNASGQSDRGKLFLPLRFGDRARGLLFLECVEQPDEQGRDYLSTLARLIAVGLFHEVAETIPSKRGKGTAARSEDRRLPRLIGRSRDMQRVLKLVGQVKDWGSTVLITGESGTGKEEVAKAIHLGGQRARRPFMAVNCAALPETLLESQLFGHERGSFTGATHRHIGFFEEASGGTIFLDEIGEMSPEMQSKLLRVLQEKQFIRLGGTRPMNTDARVLAATNRRLAEDVKAGRFREDLYFRVNVISIHIAPLREKREDIPLLVEHFLQLLADEQGMAHKRVSEEVMQIFLSHPLPGNVRQLRNVLENCMILARGDLIGVEDLPEEFLQQARPQAFSRSLDELAEMVVQSTEFSESEPLEGKLLSSVAHHMVQRLGSKVKAAKLLGISRPTLYARLKAFERENIRPAGDLRG